MQYSDVEHRHTSCTDDVLMKWEKDITSFPWFHDYFTSVSRHRKFIVQSIETLTCTSGCDSSTSLHWPICLLYAYWQKQLLYLHIAVAHLLLNNSQHLRNNWVYLTNPFCGKGLVWWNRWDIGKQANTEKKKTKLYYCFAITFIQHYKELPQQIFYCIFEFLVQTVTVYIYNKTSLIKSRISAHRSHHHHICNSSYTELLCSYFVYITFIILIIVYQLS